MTRHTSRPGALSAHLSYLFTGAPLDARPALARAAGFDAIEHPAPFEIPAARFKALLDAEGLTLAQITSGTGAPNEKGITALPGREVEFRESYARAVDYAEETGATFVHAMAGIPPEADSGGSADATYRSNLEVALRLCEGRKPRLLIEAISEAAVPGYHMCTIDGMLSLAGDLPGISVLIDTFHAATLGTDATAAIRAAGPALGHIHIADYPGRHEPGSGTLSFPDVLAALVEIGYAGAIGFEYVPGGPDHLNFIPAFRADPNMERLRTLSDGAIS